MKSLLFFGLLLSFCWPQAQAPTSLIGKWQLVEIEGNDGAKDYRTPVKDGRVLAFYPGYLVRDDKGDIGNYRVQGDQLQLLLPKAKTEFYQWFFSSTMPDKLYLSPSNASYQCICHEGCMFIRSCESAAPSGPSTNILLIRLHLFPAATTYRENTSVLS